MKRKKLPPIVDTDNITDRVDEVGHIQPKPEASADEDGVRVRQEVPYHEDTYVTAAAGPQGSRASFDTGHEDYPPADEVSTSLALLAARTALATLTEDSGMQSAWAKATGQPWPAEAVLKDVPEPVRIWIKGNWSLIEPTLRDAIQQTVDYAMHRAADDVREMATDCAECVTPILNRHGANVSGHCGALCTLTGGAVQDPV